MVTANIDHERRPSSGVDNEDDENNDRQLQARLDRLYLETSQYPHSHHQYPHSAVSSSTLRDTHMPLNTVPVYRHGRKFYVSIEEFERMRLEERRYRRTLMQKSQNLPVTKSHQTNLLTPSTSLFNPIYRSTSQSHDHRYGILRTPYLSTNSITNNNNNNHTRESIRRSRSTLRYYDDRDDLSSITSKLPMKLPTTTAIRSNSSDKILNLRSTPQSPILSYRDYISDDYELKRSFSAELVQEPQSQLEQPQTLPRRIVSSKPSDFAMSTGLSSFPIISTDQTYNQSNASKLTSYFTRIQPSTLNSPIKLSTSDFTGPNSTYKSDIHDSDQNYSVLTSSNRRTVGNGLTYVLTQSPSNNKNNEYYIRDVTSGSFSDDNSSSPSTLIQRRNINTNRHRRAQFVAETDDNYEQQDDIRTRSTARSQSSDRLTEKKRVRFADMEGFTLETVSDAEQQRLPVNNRLFIKRSYVSPSNNFQGQKSSFQNSFYPTITRVNNGGSKLATDV
ncbi:unnamed protein product [Rotaria sp. Silwood1]|nr:unnamed protein product [Rotaria sp. Silwood1]CAF1237751.1 unnamed protein product [Rotaria sp. Silwood1]CAF3500915.1 unnamed protein product [Rotaria sp. Silwood1]CAF4655557.1 unnamed protein product [Rotaria sp. Silwood1]